ncbi:MAG: enoyl-CoA hydratase/isomerase family protein [Acidimicrobiia bacterium]|nr:MAG: enoyl-CoA hydratase/isomerase family protein [Acidimicrobiia bacterium]
MGLVQFSTDGNVGIIRLDRPPVNALNGELVSAIAEAVGEAGHPSLRAMVITGGEHFAAGADIKEFAAVFERDGEDALAADLGLAVSRLEQLDKPTIAAVTGFALGGGLELAMGADFRYLAEDARVGQPEIKLGIIPGAGGTQRLTRLVGWQRAKELVLSGRMVDAAEALAIGLADQVLPPAEVVERAIADAQEWASGPTRALAAAKRAMLAGFGVEDGLEAELAEFKALFGSDDAREGVQAFVEKRDAGFTGT